ncbi:DUF3927 family protein [Klebsiella michiganensis]|uniref:DUF3927 family protein n=1 Tax=Klebsiella michiganensis TaxID=1134687 RepID=UPI00255AAC1A|nr:DUF3927 family protein [Klebsiella michiganensis]MDL4444368.1 DUF3927 family protein [Klebsiella michiganensis]MDL4486739.1 DUF3927 family protein [Klebsiella michiganensis]MDL4661577.1 DUF3927 family protein [Klebsiella michiganensis]
MIGKFRWAAAAVLLFLVVAVDFTSRAMSILADGVLVAGVIALIIPMLKKP